MAFLVHLFIELYFICFLPSTDNFTVFTVNIYSVTLKSATHYNGLLLRSITHRTCSYVVWVIWITGIDLVIILTVKFVHTTVIKNLDFLTLFYLFTHTWQLVNHIFSFSQKLKTIIFILDFRFFLTNIVFYIIGRNICPP